MYYGKAETNVAVRITAGDVGVTGEVPGGYVEQTVFPVVEANINST